MTARRNARPAVKVGAHIRFRGMKWQVVALSGQDIHLVGPDGGGEAVLAGDLFADTGFTVIGRRCASGGPAVGAVRDRPCRRA